MFDVAIHGVAVYAGLVYLAIQRFCAVDATGVKIDWERVEKPVAGASRLEPSMASKENLVAEIVK